jgi:hypothetical protein
MLGKMKRGNNKYYAMRMMVMEVSELDGGPRRVSRQKNSAREAKVGMFALSMLHKAWPRIYPPKTRTATKKHKYNHESVKYPSESWL